jgi:hypothetical protein
MSCGDKADSAAHVGSGGLGTASSTWPVVLGPLVRGRQLSRVHDSIPGGRWLWLTSEPQLNSNFQDFQYFTFWNPKRRSLWYPKLVKLFDVINEITNKNFTFWLLFQILLDFELQNLETIQIWILLEF